MEMQVETVAKDKDNKFSNVWLMGQEMKHGLGNSLHSVFVLVRALHLQVLQ